MLPIIPGSAAAAFDANFDNVLATEFNHSFNLLRGPVEGGPVVDGPPPPRPVKLRTKVDIVRPIAVKILAKVIPCSRKSVLKREASDVSSFRMESIV